MNLFNLIYKACQYIYNRERFLGSGFFLRNIPYWVLPKPKGETVVNTLWGGKIIVDATVDKGLERSIYYEGTYEFGCLYLIKMLLEKNYTFADIGANIGLMTIFASKTLENSGKVLSFEANPSTVKILEKNVEINKCTNVNIKPYALGSSTNKLKIYPNWNINRGGASLINYDKDSSAGVEVDVLKLDDVIEKNSTIDLIKIDVEGWEIEVLRGAEKILSEKNAPALIIEYVKFQESSSYKAADVYNYLKNINNYKVYKMKDGKSRVSPLVRIMTEDDLPEHDNLLYLLPQHEERLIKKGVKFLN